MGSHARSCRGTIGRPYIPIGRQFEMRNDWELKKRQSTSQSQKEGVKATQEFSLSELVDATFNTGK